MTPFIVGVISIGAVALLYLIYFSVRAARIANTPKAPEFDAVITHTYCPKRSLVPLRGHLVAKAGASLAHRLNVPLILAVGHTVPHEPRTESEIYRDYIEKTFAVDKPAILLGRNPDARDTHAETAEAARIAKERGFRRLAVIGLTPHLVRIRGYWKPYEKEFSFSFVGVSGPAKYYLWESAMFILEKIFPPNSHRRAALLNFVGRRK